MISIEDILLVGPLLAAGPDDRVFDAFLVLGPPAIIVIAVLGRTTVSTAIALAYTVGFVCYTLYKAFQ